MDFRLAVGVGSFIVLYFFRRVEYKFVLWIKFSLGVYYYKSFGWSFWMEIWGNGIVGFYVEEKNMLRLIGFGVSFKEFK